MLKVSCVLYNALISASSTVLFDITNNGTDSIWIGIQGKYNHSHLENGGFELGAKKLFKAPDDWVGVFWARTWCDRKSSHCLTSDCGNKLQCAGSGGSPPATIAQITLNGNNGLDYYAISLANGYNIGVSFEPVNARGDGTQYSCKKASCFNFIKYCPKELRLNSKHGLLACNSACSHFKTDQYCCTGDNNGAQYCKPQNWPKNYAAIFKHRCPDAYSYAFDGNDLSDTFRCHAKEYKIVFGGVN